MLFLPIAQDYFLWHYGRAFAEIFKVWMSFLWFTIHFFSIPQLLQSWFAPFKRITERRERGFNFEDWLGYIIINLMSRIVGAIMRTILLLTGFASLTIVIIIGVLTYIVWLALPFIIVGLLVSGVSLLFI